MSSYLYLRLLIFSRGRSFFKVGKLVLRSVATGAMAKLNVVEPPRELLQASVANGSESEINYSSLTEPLASQPLPTSADGIASQNQEMKKMKEELAQAKDTINEQRSDLTRCLKAIDGLKAGLFAVQEFIGRIETERATSYTNHGQSKEVENVALELQRLKRRVSVLEAKKTQVSWSGPTKAKPVQTARMTGPLARRPLSARDATSTLEHTPTHQGPTNGATKANSPVIVTSVESRDLTMGDDLQSLASESLARAEQRRGADLAATFSPSTFAGSNGTVPESHVVDETNDPVERLMGPPAPPNGRQSITAASQSVRPSVRNAPRYSDDTIELDTQEYLRRTVHVDEIDDIDYEPSQRSPSSASLRPSEMPASIEVQSSLDNILDPATPLRRRKISDAKHGRSTGRSTALSRKSYFENRRETPEWELEDWEDPRKANGTPSYTTPSRIRGSSSVRRGVSGGFGSARAPKRQKSESYGIEKERDAEGYLLRADGRRDMRSARYKKPQGEDGADNGNNGTDGNYGAIETTELNVENNAQPKYDERHEWTMGRIFPKGRKSKPGTLG